MSYSRTSFDQAVELAQLAKSWDTAPAEHVATLLSEAHAEALFADAWTTGSTFALMDALSAIQSPSKVSLVKSAPATYCKGDSEPADFHQGALDRFHANSLGALHIALKLHTV